MHSAGQALASGRITSGIKPNTFIDETITFVEDSLHQWRDDASRPIVDGEEDLNSQLCKYLNDRARLDYPMAFFHHEEKQGARRRVDISVGPTTLAIEAMMYTSIYEPFLVLEGKRLPTPGKAREREYLTGLAEKSGGVQRFRLCLHGSKLATAVMIGYIQSGSTHSWLETINNWIDELEKSGEDGTCQWSTQDRLNNIANDCQSKTARCESEHSRASKSDTMRIVHLWISLPPNRSKKTA